MSFSRFASFLYLLSFVLLIQTILGVDPLFHFCSSSEKFIDNSPYETNLNKLMGYLYLAAPPQVLGKALCRGDVSNTDCKACITEASSKIRKRCPHNKAAIICYDHCLLKYSNMNFFDQVDYQNRFYMWNLNNYSDVKFFREIDNQNKFKYNTQSVDDPTSFNTKTELLSSLSNKAFVSPVIFATGALALEGPMKLYGLAQCSRDISSLDCKRCLNGVVSEFPSCCNGKRVVGGSCNHGSKSGYQSLIRRVTRHISLDISIWYQVIS
ncbi:hypothetical protein PVL29_015546 [Vitis rotundifolia]|uniref:Gnk2-homologous domain-containing protein n=1 Tax=Vitis rotundifolia TaxID=103349 RepID=A0AA38ZD80_VITRO|nr:hypothetical protein PVL29_015546 [Vitis rotundifolia]